MLDLRLVFLLILAAKCLQFGEGCRHCKELVKKIHSYEAQKDTETFLPFYWSRTKGIYESQVKIYFHGAASKSHLRDIFYINDANMFATSWINIVLLEAYKYGQAPKPDPSQIQLSLEAITKFKDKNANYTNSLMTFWPQVYNETLKIWQSTPKNLVHFFHLADFLPVGTLENLFKKLGLKKLESYLNYFVLIKNGLLKVFHIPPDFDDTFVNLGLGALMTEMRTEFPKQNDFWLTNNRNISSVFDALKKYAYRPFSNDTAVNTIDPRSYFYLRFFLEDAKNQSRDVALVPTWVQNIDEARRLFDKGVLMPLNINNVGCTVSANVIYGITSGIVSGLLKPDILDDPEIEKIYRNTSRMVTWQLKTDMAKRPDLALLYYPSVLEFYWFVARTSSLLERHALAGKLPHAALEDTRVMFGEALRGHVTTHILSIATRVNSEVYYDDFIGNADRTLFNKPINRAEDRLFSTAMATNALQRIWTMYNETSKHNNWIHQTPSLVRETVNKTIDYLHKNIFNLQFKPSNAFYSGSVKGTTTLPFVYPANRKVGTPNANYFLYGMESVISEEEYLKMTKEPHVSNMTTPMEFHGFNNDTSAFPFWNSPPYTYATTLLALSQYENMELVEERFQPRLREAIH